MKDSSLFTKILKPDLLSSLYILRLRHKLTFRDFRILAEWLGCYQYVVPSDRARTKELDSALFAYFGSDLKRAYYFDPSYETNLTTIQQRMVTKWINEYLISLTQDS